VSEPAYDLGTGLRRAGDVTSAPPAAAPAAAPRELFVRHARKDGRSVALMRAIDYGNQCIVECEVWPSGTNTPTATRPGPYTFADARGATAFVTEAVEALMYLGCDIAAQ
jgi:hypothetical protein